MEAITWQGGAIGSQGNAVTAQFAEHHGYIARMPRKLVL
jgi:hypothetical protein